MYEFHVSKAARDRYDFQGTLFSFNGNIILGDFGAARTFTKKINDQKDLRHQPELTVYASQLYAMGLIDEILHLVVSLYRRSVDTQIMKRTLEWLEVQVGRQPLNDALLLFTREFPPRSVYQGEQNIAEYFYSSTDGTPHCQVILEELLMLWLANQDPAFSPFFELFNDETLKKDSEYQEVVRQLETFFDNQPTFGPFKQNLVEMLGSPAKASPLSLGGQLEYIRKYWGDLIGDYLDKLLRGLDFVKEEERIRINEPGPAEAYELFYLAETPERFSEDKDWMAKLVLLAKNVYVWLDQLSRKYQREVRYLHQVPDEELEYLSRCGFNGLWLIGLWERSPASRRIKQMMGNPEAIASAYSLYEYRIADDLGGEPALQDLRQRAWQHYIRLASDMVPNHMGIDSRWMRDHPDWFLSLDHSPFPDYAFNGVNLMDDQRVGVYLEDHYYDRTDAAVVFKRVDHQTGDTRFIYHGNDGTSMPWNDTAQLNYLKPEVREAVIQTILDVARRFPIIRFDAAMTLAKQHIQRLWFPEPGSGGDIPSRAQYGLTKAQFDKLMPKEFWVEVVDRVAQEVPDTLLLAEAFWMMEGYFVRTLGMHRVYNSAFMHMLRDEDNAQYRQVVKNTLEFNPQILKRYVNFMNNPDEDTAIAQFGNSDKYFGVCTMMVTLPGLPMFGHGQVEGFTEKYGMEYKRAYLDEQPDQNLVDRHARQIFPLLHRRKLFAEVENYLLYDFFGENGAVNEDVFAYSNRLGDERALVLYHNHFGDTRGWVRTSVAVARDGEEDQGKLIQYTLGQGLALPNHSNAFVIYREYNSNLEYIRSCKQIHEQGLYFALDAYRCLVYLDFRVVYDSPEMPYAGLSASLAGQGVVDIRAALHELEFQRVHVPFKELMNAGMFQYLIENGRDKVAVQQVKQKYQELVSGITDYLGKGQNTDKFVRQLVNEYKALIKLANFQQSFPASRLRGYKAACETLAAGFVGPEHWGTALGWLFIHGLGKLADSQDTGELSQDWVDDWLLGKWIKQAFAGLGTAQDQLNDSLVLLKTLLSQDNWLFDTQTDPKEAVKSWFGNPQVQSWLKVNRYNNVLWFNQESMEEWLWWVLALSALNVVVKGKDDIPRQVVNLHKSIQKIKKAVDKSGYRVEALVDLL
jgi:glycosidase